MNSPRTFFLLLVALLIFCFGLAANLVPRFQALESRRHQSNNFFSLLLGDSSRMFANSFFVKADEYYHSGYYPTIFDNKDAFQTPHLAEDTGAVNSQNHGEETGFMGPPRDWLDAFGRHFIPNRHTHLDEGGPSDDLSTSSDVREILPWLKLSTELDPDNITTYTVTAYWLERMNKNDEAHRVLLEAWRNNPDSYDILYALGQLYDETDHDTNRARNVWELAAKKWMNLDNEGKKENRLIFEQITSHLGQLEENAGNLPQSLNWFHAAQLSSLTPDVLQKRIDEVQAKMAAQTNRPTALPR
jgi:tetratricopeptide (TPR) repeat protein